MLSQATCRLTSVYCYNVVCVIFSYFPLESIYSNLRFKGLDCG